MIRPDKPASGGDHRIKERLRICLKERRAVTAGSDRRAYSRQITGYLLGLLSGFSTILVYVSKDPEVDTRLLITELLSRGADVVVPIIERESRTLRLSYLRDPDHLSVSTFNVPEPIGHEIPADPECIQAAVIPLIGFDAAGNRIGYGAGYYDRYLSQSPHVVKIGIGFSCQEAERIPCEDFDIRMDYIVTELGVIRCPGRNPPDPQIRRSLFPGPFSVENHPESPGAINTRGQNLYT
ncbi:MAG: 5-formyltetrahydrofolate cyclo-ligase [Methanomicrobiales archaeon]|nr:5-formyltetrahydrofolate cyclo-ligase [Methanomicrobiales archaeon]